MLDYVSPFFHFSLINQQISTFHLPYYARLIYHTHLILVCYANALIIIRLAALRDRSHLPGSPQMHCSCVMLLIGVFF